MNKEKFKKMLSEVLKFEGKYSFDKDDAGGETYMGICRKYYPTLSIWGSLDKMKLIGEKRGYKPTDKEMEEIENVYFKNFYQKANIDGFNDLALAMEIFDFSVNAGISTAVKTLQRLMHITVDGICGRQTVTTANVRHKLSVREDYRKARIAYYNGISTKGNNKKYLKGWIKRAETCDKVFL